MGNEYIKLSAEISHSENDRLNKKIKLKVNTSDLDIWEIRDEILKPILIGVGYHPETVDMIINNEEVL